MQVDGRASAWALVNRAAAPSVMQVDGRASAWALVNRAAAPSAMLVGLPASVFAYVSRAAVAGPFPAGSPALASIRTRIAAGTSMYSIKRLYDTIQIHIRDEPCHRVLPGRPSALGG